MAFTCTKTFDCVSTAHRNWRAKDNPNRDSKKCSYIHGYTKSFSIVFGCESLDEFQWVYDYGTTSTGKERTMTSIKKFIQETLDHGVTTDDQDPMLAKLFEMHELELIKLVVIPVKDGQSGSVEGLCRFMYNTFDPQLRRETNNRVWIESITISEHHKNSSTYTREEAICLNTQQFGDNTKMQEQLEKYLNTDYGEDFKNFNFFDEPTFEQANKKMNEVEDDHNNVYYEILNGMDKDKVMDIGKKIGIDFSQLFPKGKSEVIKKTLEDAGYRKSQEQSTDKNFTTYDKVEQKDEDFLDKILTKENLERGLKLLQFHPKYKVLATTLLMADDLKDMLLKNKDLKQSILSNPFILELLKKGIK